MFNIAFSKFVGRADVYRDDTLDANSTFSKVSVHTDKNGILVLRDNVIMSVEMTQESDIVLFNVTALNYGKNETQGASILSRIIRYFEARETVYVAAKRVVNEDETESIVVTNVMRNRRESGQTVWHNTSLTFGNAPLTDVDKDCFALLVQRFIERAESGKLPQDQRKESFDGVTTNYGHFVAQRKAERA